MGSVKDLHNEPLYCVSLPTAFQMIRHIFKTCLSSNLLCWKLCYIQRSHSIIFPFEKHEAGYLSWSKSPLLFFAFALRVAITYICLTVCQDLLTVIFCKPWPLDTTLWHGRFPQLSQLSALSFSSTWSNQPHGVSPVSPSVSEWRINTCPCGFIM